MSRKVVQRVLGVSQRSCSSWLWPLLFLPGGLLFTAGFVYLAFISDFESDLWFAPLGVVIEPFGLIAFTLFTVIAGFRALQVVGVLGVVYLRAFDDGSALLGSWWRVRKGHGLVVDQNSKIRLKVTEGNERNFGWFSRPGIPVYMQWKISRTGASFNWLTPFAATPDATTRIHAALRQLPEPTYDTLDTSHAAHAA